MPASIVVLPIVPIVFDDDGIDIEGGAIGGGALDVALDGDDDGDGLDVLGGVVTSLKSRPCSTVFNFDVVATAILPTTIISPPEGNGKSQETRIFPWADIGEIVGVNFSDVEGIAANSEVLDVATFCQKDSSSRVKGWYLLPFFLLFGFTAAMKSPRSGCWRRGGATWTQNTDTLREPVV